MSVKAEDFNYIADLVRKQTGIVLETGKEYLVESRLAPMARREGFGSLQELVARLRVGSGNGLGRRITEALTTNETLFFRDIAVFDAFTKSMMPSLLAKRAQERKLNIWCAACSSGQEPYSLAMLIREELPQVAGWTLRLLASDLSTEMIRRAQAGRYTQLEINRGLPARYLVRYFSRDNLDWEISPSIRRAVEFFQHNLTEPWPPLPPMDVIFLRNVLIYFDVETKKQILKKVARSLRADGFLVLGGAETTLQISDLFERVGYNQAGYYRLRATTENANVN